MDLRAQLQATLGDAYTLERELGGGGMSRVFVAEEARLGRRVVVKVLAPELTEGMSAERFEREIRLAARLQHPNIVPVLASGERGGLAYYTMPYVEGESLRERLAGQGRLPLDTAVSVLRDVARALEYAHGHGVVHRDVKPDNILLSGSAAAVADFGIAKALDAARTAGATATADAREHAHGAPAGTLTRVGTSLGTPAYMAPEQAAGDPNVDARADIYAWGVVAYELLAGVPPFAGRAAHQLIVAHIGESPPSLAVRVPDVPTALAALVMRCLEKAPTDRPQSATELLAALEVARTTSGELRAAAPVPSKARDTSRRRLRIGAAALLASVLVSAAGVAAYRASRPTANEQPVLVVIPFENLGPPSDAYFADGLTDEVRSRLAAITGLRVIAGASARQYRGTTKSLRDVARELGATHLLTGTVRWERSADGAGQVRVSPELVRATDQATVWGESSQGPLADVFQLQSQVAERVAEALDVALLGRERRALAVRPTDNLAAYDAYLRGTTARGRWQVAGLPSALIELERAVALDPNFALAHARLAEAYALEQDMGSAGPETVEKAQASAARAWALDSSLADAGLARGAVLFAAGDVPEAVRVLRTAVAAAPNNVELLNKLAQAEEYAGRMEPSIAHLQRAAALDPRSPTPLGTLARLYERTGRYEEAIRTREREFVLAPVDNAVGFLYHAWSYLLWRADTVSASRQVERGGPAVWDDWLVRLPTGPAGGTIWYHGVFPLTTVRARDTLTLRGYRAGTGGLTPDLFYLMKIRHFTHFRKFDLVRAYADTLVGRLEPALRGQPDEPLFWGLYSRRQALAEAYAALGRGADAARESDQYVAEARRAGNALLLPQALVNAARIDASMGRRDVAVQRLAEALRLPAGLSVSRPLLRADPTWAPLRGHPAFERLLDGRQ